MISVLQVLMVIIQPNSVCPATIAAKPAPHLQSVSPANPPTIVFSMVHPVLPPLATSTTELPPQCFALLSSTSAQPASAAPSAPAVRLDT